MRISEKQVGLIYRGFSFSYYEENEFAFEKEKGLTFYTNTTLRAENKKLELVLEIPSKAKINDTKINLKNLIDTMYDTGIIRH